MFIIFLISQNFILKKLGFFFLISLSRNYFPYLFTANEYLFVSPNRYVFPGAEVYDKEDDSDSSSGNSDSDTDSDDEASDEDPKPEGAEQSADTSANPSSADDASANPSADDAEQIPANTSSQPQSNEVVFSKITTENNPTLEKNDDDQ